MYLELEKVQSQESHLWIEEDIPLSPSEMTPEQWSWGVNASLERARTPAVDIGMGQHSSTSALQRSFASSASRNLQGHANSASRSQALRQCLRCMLYTGCGQ